MAQNNRAEWKTLLTIVILQIEIIGGGVVFVFVFQGKY